MTPTVSRVGDEIRLHFTVLATDRTRGFPDWVTTTYTLTSEEWRQVAEMVEKLLEADSARNK